MGEVRYSINGKYFKDYGVYVSSSLGLLDALKRKPIKTYDWAEYHGESLDLSNPKYEAREIVLNCFVTGDNYEEMFINFRNIVMSEFQKSGTQRLLVEAFGLKALPYEVYLIDDVKLLKEFKNSKTVGTFQLKLIEPNPVKKVLYLTDNTLNLSYNSSKENEIFFVNGEKTTAKGNVSLSGKTLASRNVGSYGFNGRNLFKKTTNVISIINTSGINKNELNGFTVTVSTNDSQIRINKVLTENGQYTFSGYVTCTVSGTVGVNFTDTSFDSISVSPTRTKFSITKTISNYTEQVYNFIDLNNLPAGTYVFENIKIEKGNKATDWSPAPEDEKFIIIAGDIDGITNLTTNAVVLWEKL